jgi:hypothetical protein
LAIQSTKAYRGVCLQFSSVPRYLG